MKAGETKREAMLWRRIECPFGNLEGGMSISVDFIFLKTSVIFKLLFN